MTSRALAEAAPGRWVGPPQSAYGLHLLLVTAVEPTTLPPFEQVRAAVDAEGWRGGLFVGQLELHADPIGAG